MGMLIVFGGFIIAPIFLGVVGYGFGSIFGAPVVGTLAGLSVWLLLLKKLWEAIKETNWGGGK